MYMPDQFFDQDAPTAQVEKAGLGCSGIVATVTSALGIENFAKTPVAI